MSLWLFAFGQEREKVPLVTYYRFNTTEVQGDDIIEYIGKGNKLYRQKNDANVIESNYTMCIMDDIYAVAPSSQALKSDSTIFYVQGPASFYINMSSGLLQYVWETGGEYFDINSVRDSIQWEITSERKEILGIACRKAIGTLDDGSIATVWYSEEIAIPFGPNRIWGTPGLVVTLQLGAFNYVLIGVEYCDKVSEIKYVSRGQKMTEEEYDRYVEERIKKYAEPVQEGNTTRRIIIYKKPN